MANMFLLLYRSAAKKLTPTEQLLKSIVESPLSVEILYDVVTSLRIKAGLSDYEARQTLKECFNDWDK